jgi:cyclic pyranopterin phosphate synthase
LYQFTDEERVAWGSRPQAGSLQQVLAEVAKARLLAATDDEKSEQQHGGNDEKNDTVLGHDNNNSRIILSPTNNLNGVVPSIPSTQQHESFSHLSEDGRSIHMVDVGGKEVTARMAHAQSKVILPQSVLEAFGLLGVTSSSSSSSDEEMVGPKGPIFTTAKLAGIMAAKRTSDLIPLCHPLPLDQVQIDIRLDRYIPPTSADSHGNNDDVGGNKARGYGVVTIDCTCRVTHRTGVEMEALTGATVAALTVYDMTKAVSHEIEITGTKLIAKTGGKRVVQRSPPNAANEN